jgi:hypothetical protein
VNPDDPATTALDAAWQAYQDEEAAARTAYLDAVATAQRHFDADVAPAMTAYHSAERAAWQAFNMMSRAAKRRYLDATTHATAVAATPPLPAADATPATPDSPGRGPWAPRLETHPYPQTGL